MTEDENQAAKPNADTQDAQRETEASSPEQPEETPPVDPLEEARAEASQMKDKLMRMAADFDNFRKRSRREVADAEKKGRDSLLNDLLPVFDNLERATAHAQTSSDDSGAGVKGLVDGITLVMKQFRDALGRLGIERVESLGQPFDPSMHEAIQHLETADFPPGCIAAEVQPGYRQGDRLVRPAMVVVAKAPIAPPLEREDDASENRQGGASENRQGGASDDRQDGASDDRQGDPDKKGEEN